MHILRLYEVIAIIWSLTAIALLFTLGRFGIHWHKRRRLGWDDFFNGLAMAFLLGFTSTYQMFGPTEYSTQLYEMGLIKESEIPEGTGHDSKWNSANSLMFWCVIYAVKASFLALYWHIFSVSTKFRIAWWITSIYIVISFGITFMWSFWICGHPKYFPDSQPQCHENSPKIVYPMMKSWCALDLFGDFLLIALPVAMLKPLLMKTSQKVELAIIFGLVVVNMVLTILRTVYSLDVDLMRFPDQNILWVFLQVTITVIVCALPCYRGILSRKKNESLRRIQRFNSDSSEFAEIWQRYLVSIGERRPASTSRDMEQSADSATALTYSSRTLAPQL